MATTQKEQGRGKKASGKPAFTSEECFEWEWGSSFFVCLFLEIYILVALDWIDGLIANI